MTDISILIDFLCVFVLAHVYFIFYGVGLFVYFVYDFNNNNYGHEAVTSLFGQPCSHPLHHSCIGSIFG